MDERISSLKLELLACSTYLLRIQNFQLDMHILVFCIHSVHLCNKLSFFIIAKQYVISIKIDLQ